MPKYSKRILVLKKEEAGVIGLEFSVPGPTLISGAADSAISSDSYTVAFKGLFITKPCCFRRVSTGISRIDAKTHFPGPINNLQHFLQYEFDFHLVLLRSELDVRKFATGLISRYGL